jgi:uncharacterized membrane protein
MTTVESDRGGTRGVGWMTLAAGAAVGVGVYYLLRSTESQRQRAELTGIPDPYLTESMTINQPIERVYDAWCNLASVGFMQDVEITGSRQHEMYEWQAPSGAVGRVEFRTAPGQRGTEVHVHLERGAVRSGGKIARMLSIAADQQIRVDLRRFKQLLEAGELTLSDGPGLSRPAQPASSGDQPPVYVGERP